MSYIQNGGTGGGGSGTVTNTGGALTSNAVVLGAGGNDEKVTTAFTTDGAATMTVGVAGGGNGVLALSGNTSGTATLTAPAVAGTRSNQVVSSNSLQLPDGSKTGVSLSFATNPTRGWYHGTNVPAWIMADGTNDALAIGTNASNLSLLSSGIFGFSSSATILNAGSSSRDTTLSRMGAGIIQVNSGSGAGNTGLIQSGMTVFVTGDFTTSGVGTALEAITGLSITVPATAANWKFHAHLAYHQNVGLAAVGFGIQAVTNNPTNIFATGTMGTSATAFTAGVLATLATTTATQIVSATPSAITTNWVTDLAGTCELGASANTIRLLVSTATAADTVTILRGSYFSFCP